MVEEYTSLGAMNNFIRDNDVTVIDFYRKEGCIWCKRLDPHFEAAAQQIPDIAFAKVDVDVLPEVIEEFQLLSVPTVLLFDGSFYGNPLAGRTVGELVSELSNVIRP